MVLCLHKFDDKMVFIQLAEMVTIEDGLKFLHSLDYTDLVCASLCKNDGEIIYQIADLPFTE